LVGLSEPNEQSKPEYVRLEAIRQIQQYITILQKENKPRKNSELEIEDDEWHGI
jgi:hypothetical protein